MKILKVKMDVTQTENKNQTSYKYPVEYDATKNVGFLIYGTGSELNYCITCVKDIDSNSWLESKNITEISNEQALEFGNAHTKQIEQIIDKQKVISILANQALTGNELSQLDKDTLNPGSSEIGINITKPWSEYLNEAIFEYGEL